MSSGGRRQARAEIEATWQVWDARRPLRKEDMAAPSPPDVVDPDDVKARESERGGT